jgi:hypothetical protein
MASPLQNGRVQHAPTLKERQCATRPRATRANVKRPHALTVKVIADEKLGKLSIAWSELE